MLSPRCGRPRAFSPKTAEKLRKTRRIFLGRSPKSATHLRLAHCLVQRCRPSLASVTRRLLSIRVRPTSAQRRCRIVTDHTCAREPFKGKLSPTADRNMRSPFRHAGDPAGDEFSRHRLCRKVLPFSHRRLQLLATATTNLSEESPGAPRSRSKRDVDPCAIVEDYELAAIRSSSREWCLASRISVTSLTPDHSSP